MNQNKASLKELIDNFDVFYEMSDSSYKIQQGHNGKEYIKDKLKYLGTGELQQLKESLSGTGKVAYDRYFKT